MKTALIGFWLTLSLTAGCASTAKPTADQAAPVTVAVSRVTVTELATSFEAGGVVRARNTALIASRMLAPITRVHVRPGDRVHRGTPLVTLDAREIQANKGRAEATSLSTAEAALAADADVRTAESALSLARATHDRMAALHAKRSATTQELDQAVAALSAAEAQRAGAQARLAAANAARDASKAASEVATISSTYAVLSAPFDGIVTERHADAGSMATPGTTLLILEDPATYRLEVQLDEARATLVETGQMVSTRLEALSPADGWVDGRIAEIARVDPASHGFLVKIDLPTLPVSRSGLFGRARFSGPARRTLTVPVPALIKRGQLTFVYLVDTQSQVRLRPISIGAAAGDRAEVLAGLREGNVVVTNPPASLTDGARVAQGRP